MSFGYCSLLLRPACHAPFAWQAVVSVDIIMIVFLDSKPLSLNPGMVVTVTGYAFDCVI